MTVMRTMSLICLLAMCGTDSFRAAAFGFVAPHSAVTKANNRLPPTSSCATSSASRTLLQSSFTGDNFGETTLTTPQEDEGDARKNYSSSHYREMMARARGYAYYRRNDMGAPSPQDAQQVLEELFSMADWCTTAVMSAATQTTTAGASTDVCDNVDEMTSIVVRLRELAASSSSSLAETQTRMTQTLTTALTWALVLFVVAASFISAPPGAVDATTAASIAQDLEDFQSVAVDGFIWTM